MYSHDVAENGFSDGFIVGDSAGGGHEVHDDFVCHADDRVGCDFAWKEFLDGLVREAFEGGED